MATAKRELDTKKLKTTTTKSFYGGVMSKDNLQYLTRVVSHSVSTYYSRQGKRSKKVDSGVVAVALRDMLNNGKRNSALVICLHYRLVPDGNFSDTIPIIGNGLVDAGTIIKLNLIKDCVRNFVRHHGTRTAFHDLVVMVSKMAKSEG